MNRHAFLLSVREGCLYHYRFLVHYALWEQGVCAQCQCSVPAGALALLTCSSSQVCGPA